MPSPAPGPSTTGLPGLAAPREFLNLNIRAPCTPADLLAGRSRPDTLLQAAPLHPAPRRYGNGGMGSQPAHQLRQTLGRPPYADDGALTSDMRGSRSGEAGQEASVKKAVPVLDMTVDELDLTQDSDEDESGARSGSGEWYAAGRGLEGSSTFDRGAGHVDAPPGGVAAGPGLHWSSSPDSHVSPRDPYLGLPGSVPPASPAQNAQFGTPTPSPASSPPASSRAAAPPASSRAAAVHASPGRGSMLPLACAPPSPPSTSVNHTRGSTSAASSKAPSPDVSRSSSGASTLGGGLSSPEVGHDSLTSASASATVSGFGAPALRLGQLAPHDNRRVAAAGAGGDGPEIPLMFRITKPRNEHMPTYDAIKDDDPDRETLYAAARRLAELAVEQSLATYIMDGKRALSQVYELEGNENLLPHIAYGTATEPIHRWAKNCAAPIPAESTGTRFLERLPDAGIVVIVGLDGLTDVPESLLADFAVHLKEGCEVVVTRGGGSKRPLVVTREELIAGIEAHVAGEDMSDVARDVRKWLEGMRMGLERRIGAGQKMQAHGGEITRSAFRRKRGEAPQQELADPAAEDEEPEDEAADDDEEADGFAQTTAPRIEPPRGWHSFFRCPHCPFVGQSSALKKHTVAAKREDKTGKCRCLGFCPAGCPMQGKSVSQIRAHVEQHHPSLILCPRPECIAAFAKRISLTAHESQHLNGKVHASGIPRSNVWITIERAMSCRVYTQLDSDDEMEDG